MPKVNDFLAEFRSLGADEFSRKFQHPFLLYADQVGHGGFRSYHTRMADRDAVSSLADSEKTIREFQVLVPKKITKKLLVGRSPERELTIDHSTVSKRHAYLLYDDASKAYKLGDAGSTNGTMINGQKLEAGEPIFLRDGWVISFGDCDFMFFSPEGFAALLTRLV